MRIAFVQTYPIYHDSWSTDGFLQLRNRDRWMPGILASNGHEVELWGVDLDSSVHRSCMEGFGDYSIRLFARDGGGGATKVHRSSLMIEHAHHFAPDLCVLKGADGGSGLHLLKHYLLPARHTYAVVIGGKYYARHLERAAAVLYESEIQRARLVEPGWRLWRTRISPERLVRLPKSVDTARFRPVPEIEKEYDVMIVGRLVRRLKSFSVLPQLASAFRVAVVGDGPDAEDLQSQLPGVSWLGWIPHKEMPQMLNRTRLLFHPGGREYYPRVLAEAASCGIPAVAFADAIAEDVLPQSVGLRVSRTDFVRRVADLLGDAERMTLKSLASRAHSERSTGMYSSRASLETMIRLVHRPHGR